MSDSLTIYHNPKCSKSRKTLELLRERGHEPEVIEYLKTGVSRPDLQDILAKLGVPARAMVRKKETAYAEQGLTEVSDAGELLDAIVASPILLERPIVVLGERAVVGRPPENVLALL